MNRDDWKAKGLVVLNYLKDLLVRVKDHPDVAVAGAIAGAVLVLFL